MPPYLLTPHSYACESDGYGVFLDLKRDRYTAVTPDSVHTLRAAIKGWGLDANAGPERPMSDAIAADDRGLPATDDRLIRALLKENLLTTDTARGKSATPPHVDEPTESLWEFPRPWPDLTTESLVKFTSAWIETTVILRALPIRYVIARQRSRNLRKQREIAPFDIQRARLLTATCFALQPMYYSAKDACLRNSLTLLRFLSRYEVYPTCVFGVKTHPSFLAHAWLQHGSVVFTDPIDSVRGFTPIMLV